MRGRGLRSGRDLLGSRGRNRGGSIHLHVRRGLRRWRHPTRPVRISMNARAWIAERVERARRPRVRPRRVNTPVRAPWATKAVALMLPADIDECAGVDCGAAERARRPKARPRRVNTPVRAPWATKVVASMQPARISTNVWESIAERVERARRPRVRPNGSIHLHVRRGLRGWWHQYSLHGYR